MTEPRWFSGVDRQLRAVQDTPLAPMADALINRGGIYQDLLELGWTTPTPDRRSAFKACGFDDQNGWHWLDVEVAPPVLDAWLDPGKQRQVRALLNTRILLFKPTDNVVRLWWIPPGRRTARYGRGRGKPPPGSYDGMPHSRDGASEAGRDDQSPASGGRVVE